MTDSITVYGIPNCDTVKKARKWLDANKVSYEFHDYKKKGIDKAHLKAWSAVLGWETLVNRRGTTWRKLPDEDKTGLTEAKAIRLLMDNTSMIKRPVIEAGDDLLIGFDAGEYEKALSS